MTREEAIARIKNYKIVHKMNEPRAIYIYISEALDMAIKALEQEPILDKIKAEIEQLPRYGAKFPNRYLTVHVDIYEVLSIIDKYRGEVDCRECKTEYECYYCKNYEESEDKE